MSFILLKKKDQTWKEIMMYVTNRTAWLVSITGLVTIIVLMVIAFLSSNIWIGGIAVVVSWFTGLWTGISLTKIEAQITEKSNENHIRTLGGDNGGQT
jgi:hypothetical protein